MTMVQQLLEFLSLPIWQRRHELYSAWVSTQILDAIPAEPVRIHTVGDKLVFAFSGTHLATADAYQPRLHVWAELRSPLEDPIGKSRSASIQPDYTLVTDPITSPEASILEVECKQYRRPSVRNFSDALTDYARGRPNAIVVLVNYGVTGEASSENILRRVDLSVRERTFLIGNLRPGSIQAQEDFRQLIQQAIAKRYPLPLPPAQPIQIVGQAQIDLREPARASLSWQAEPSDLDLCLRIDLSSKVYEINYSYTGSRQAEPWSELDADIQKGAGTETIYIDQWMDGSYHFFVHNYSKERILAGCGAELHLTNGSNKWEYVCPAEGNGEWWSVVKVDGHTGEMQVIDQIVEKPW
jgi:hypothetical protein